MPRSSEIDMADGPSGEDGGSPPGSPVGESSDYRIPKLRVKARVTLRDQDPRSILLHLCERAEFHAGPERPSDLLRGPRDFLPVGGPDGRVLFLSTHAIDVLTVPAGLEQQGPGGLDDAAGADPRSWVERDLCLHLDDGTLVTGRVRYLPEPGRGRLLDLLNGPAPFVPVREGEVVHLVNKRRVAYVAADMD